MWEEWFQPTARRTLWGRGELKLTDWPGKRKTKYGSFEEVPPKNARNITQSDYFSPFLHCQMGDRIPELSEKIFPCMELSNLRCKIGFFFAWSLWMWCPNRVPCSMCSIWHFAPQELPGCPIQLTYRILSGQLLSQLPFFHVLHQYVLGRPGTKTHSKKTFISFPFLWSPWYKCHIYLQLNLNNLILKYNAASISAVPR